MTRPHLTSLTNRLPWKTSLAFVVFSLCIAMFTSTSGGSARYGLYLRSVPGGGFEECPEDRAEVDADWITSEYPRGPVFRLYRVRSQVLGVYVTPLWDFSAGPTAEIARPVAARIFDARFPGRVLPELAQKWHAQHRQLLWYGVILNALFALALLVLILKLAALAAHLLPCHDRSSIGRAA